METEKKSVKESEAFKTFREAFEGEKEIEGKVRLALDFMKAALADPQNISFKDFWEAKKLCGPLFKEQINPAVRSALWSEYAEMGDEARRLKEIKDEEAAFSIEQIEIALAALEKDIEQYQTLLGQIPAVHFPKGIDKLHVKKGEYDTVQRELDLLKTLIARLDGLRKEVLATDMRISHKNKILKRISKSGDEIFPKRKELIKTVSDMFINDVEAFVKRRFPEGEETLKAPYYVIRDEIKCFQGLAKVLSLNTQAFTKSRKTLSQGWDKIKVALKEKQAEMEERSEEFQKNYEELRPKVEAFETFCQGDSAHDRRQISAQGDTLLQEMRKTPLGRDHVKELRDRIQKAQGSALDKAEARIQEKKQAARKEIDDLRERLSHAIQKESTTSLGDLEKEAGELLAAYEKLNLNATEIHRFERSFADLKSFIFDKKEQDVPSEGLEELYDARASHVDLIKAQVEEYRKEMGGSSLDFEKAMTYRELYDSAKIHLDKEVGALENLEEKLV